MLHGSVVCFLPTIRIESRAKSTIFDWHCGIARRKPHAKLIRVVIRLSNIYSFKQQKFVFLQLLNLSNLRSELKSTVLFVGDLEFTITL